TISHSHHLAHLRARPRLPWQPGPHHRANSGDFSVIDRYRVLAVSDNLKYSRCHKYRQTVQRVEPAKQVAGEQWQLELFYSVRPAPPGLVHRQERLVSFATELGGHHVLTPGFRLQ